MHTSISHIISCVFLQSLSISIFIFLFPFFSYLFSTNCIFIYLIRSLPSSLYTPRRKILYQGMVRRHSTVCPLCRFYNLVLADTPSYDARCLWGTIYPRTKCPGTAFLGQSVWWTIYKIFSDTGSYQVPTLQKMWGYFKPSVIVSVSISIVH